mmetsp:Transcript_5898/g.15127  ORF Transcript_5898/g.15127 Transcript_5898/m.15127 type:complete len:354 (-) Transcript_5898:808-1869(-)
MALICSCPCMFCLRVERASDAPSPLSLPWPDVSDLRVSTELGMGRRAGTGRERIGDKWLSVARVGLIDPLDRSPWVQARFKTGARPEGLCGRDAPSPLGSNRPGPVSGDLGTWAEEGKRNEKGVGCELERVRDDWPSVARVGVIGPPDWSPCAQARFKAGPPTEAQRGSDVPSPLRSLRSDPASGDFGGPESTELAQGEWNGFERVGDESLAPRIGLMDPPDGSPSFQAREVREGRMKIPLVAPGLGNAALDRPARGLRTAVLTIWRRESLWLEPPMLRSKSLPWAALSVCASHAWARDSAAVGLFAGSATRTWVTKWTAVSDAVAHPGASNSIWPRRRSPHSLKGCEPETNT